MSNDLVETVVVSDPPHGNGRTAMKFTFEPESRPLDGYTIKRAIQRGGFGEVYYALSDAGKEVALKLIQQNMDIELRGVSQCLNLKHPNLVTIFDIRTDADGDHWVIMEYVSGKSLDRVLAEHPQGMPVQEAERWLSGIAAGVGYLHDRGIVHRDLKPANIYSEHGIVKTGDVGLSKFISPSRRSAHTQSVGTVYYMAPEVAHGRYGREVDVYGLAIMTYELLTGRVPFDGETTGEILMKHLSMKPDLSPLPARLRPVLARALEKDPQLRTGSVEQLEAEFKDAVRGRETPLEIPANAFGAHRPATEQYAQSEPAPQPDFVSHDDTDPRSAERPRAGQGQHHKGHRRQGKKHFARMAGELFRKALPVIIILAIFAPQALGFITRSAGLCAIIFAAGYIAYRVVGLLANAIIGPDHDGASAGLEAGNRDGTVPTATPAMPVAARRRRKSVPPPLPQPVRQSQPAPVVKKKPRTQLLTPNTKRSISLRQRVTEVSGSMAVAALCTVVITVGLCAVTNFLSTPSAVGLFAVTTLMGAWAIMLPAKTFEGFGDVWMRRMVFLVLGGAVGTVAYWLDQNLMVDFEYSSSQPSLVVNEVADFSLMNDHGQPALAGYVLFFAGLFFLRRWWWHADAFRPHRLRLSSLLLTLGLGFVLSALLRFPFLWGMTWAVAISSVVQLASIWVPPAERVRLTTSPNHEQHA